MQFSTACLMTYKNIFLFILFFNAIFLQLNAQNKGFLSKDSLSKNVVKVTQGDSVSNLNGPALDTITPKILMLPDTLVQGVASDTSKSLFGYPQINFSLLIDNFLKHSTTKYLRQKGDLMPRGEVWVFVVVIFLLLIFSLYKNSFSKQLWVIVQASFSSRALSDINKEDHIFNSWPFILLFVQSGFTIGFFLFLAISRQNLATHYGFDDFVLLSVAVLLLWGFKIILLKILGLFFKIQKPVGEYVSLLYLSFFDLYLFFVPLTFAYALTPVHYNNFFIALGVSLFAGIFVFQFIRSALNILFNYQFSKVYLFLYFCALEICPILIFIKAIYLRGN